MKPSDEFMHFVACISQQQLAAIQTEQAQRINAAVTKWLECGGTYEQWWNAVSEANAYLVKGGAS